MKKITPIRTDARLFIALIIWRWVVILKPIYTIVCSLDEEFEDILSIINNDSCIPNYNNVELDGERSNLNKPDCSGVSCNAQTENAEIGQSSFLRSILLNRGSARMPNSNALNSSMVAEHSNIGTSVQNNEGFNYMHNVQDEFISSSASRGCLPETSTSHRHILPNENTYTPHINLYLQEPFSGIKNTHMNAESYTSMETSALQPSIYANQEAQEDSQNLNNYLVGPSSMDRKRVYTMLEENIVIHSDLVKYVIKNSDEYIYFTNIINAHKISALNKNNQDEEHIAPLFNNPKELEVILKLVLYIENAILTNQNIWIGLSVIKKESIQIRLEFIMHYLKNLDLRDKSFNKFYFFYYYKMFQDLYLYLTREKVTCYNMPTEFLPNHRLTPLKYNEITLGDIYIKKDINLLWHAESMMTSYVNPEITSISENKDQSLEAQRLKRQMLLILSIPEIYEDLLYMNYKEIGMLQDIIAKEFSESSAGCTYNLKFCVIEYLYGFVHNNTEIMESSYKKIQEQGLDDFNDIALYQYVYKIFIEFYKYSLYLYQINTDIMKNSSTDIQNTRSTVELDKNYLARKQYTKIPKTNITEYQGKGVVSMQILIKIIKKINYNHQYPCKRILDKIKCSKATYGHITRESLELSHSFHYHVQLVDNYTHRMHILHLPFFVEKTKYTTKYHQIHTLREIKEYINKTFSTKRYKDRPLTNSVYPFKYSRSDKTWSIVDDYEKTLAKKTKVSSNKTVSDMDKTIEEMNNSGFDVVFYYIKENIKLTRFLFAYLNPIGAKLVDMAYKENEDEAKKLFNDYELNTEAPRIPLFLPKIMSSVIHTSPYVLKSEYYVFAPIFNYKNLVPVEFSNWLETIVDRKDISSRIIELVKVYRRDINYYSDFYILGTNSAYEDCACYIMNVVQKDIPTNKNLYSPYNIEISWCMQKHYNIGEYNNYYLKLPKKTIRKTRRNNIKKEYNKKTIFLFLNMLQRMHVSRDMLRYGVCIYILNDAAKSIKVPILCPIMKSHLDSLLSEENKMHHMLSPILKKNIQKLKDHQNINPEVVYNASEIYITVKNVNYTKSKLGLHYNILSSIF
ncbi:hypothetical protein NEIRO03_0181 [Nematocida sp. AWRm78]|nr:hypothetical protein NEIRO02_0182 [Nematocida sp. AWRm79]KAI5182517.1 hypothetical protein NEIRO03_0181 [Nematocida sp. AWRm78]